MLGLLIRRPLRLLSAMGYVLSLTETPLAARLRLLALIGSAADMASRCSEEGIAHVHIHSCANAAHLGALAHILTGLSYSLTLHGDLRVYGTDHRAKMRNAGFVSAVTRPLQAALRREIGTTQHYPVISMGVDTARFCPSTDRSAAQETDRLEVVTVARLNRTKGHHFFLRAMAKLRDEGIDIHYRIAGDGPERQRIEAEIAELGLAGQVTLMGSVGEDVVLQLLRSCDALALNSIGEGEAAPVALMEAMSCGVPAVCSIIGGTADMIQDGVDGFLVPQEDVEAIAEAVRQFVADPDRRKRMGKAARTTALEKFDHRRNAMALFGEIRELALRVP